MILSLAVMLLLLHTFGVNDMVEQYKPSDGILYKLKKYPELRKGVENFFAWDDESGEVPLLGGPRTQGELPWKLILAYNQSPEARKGEGGKQLRGYLLEILRQRGHLERPDTRPSVTAFTLDRMFGEEQGKRILSDEAIEASLFDETLTA